MANKPNIRFEGFTDDWEQGKVKQFLILKKLFHLSYYHKYSMDFRKINNIIGYIGNIRIKFLCFLFSYCSKVKSILY